MAAQAIEGRTGGKPARAGVTRARRTAAAILVAISFAAILVHGRTGRPAQPQFAKVGEMITACDRPTLS